MFELSKREPRLSVKLCHTRSPLGQQVLSPKQLHLQLTTSVCLSLLNRDDSCPDSLVAWGLARLMIHSYV